MSKAVRTALVLIIGNVIHWIFLGFSLYPEEWMGDVFIIFILVFAWLNIFLNSEYSAWSEVRRKK